MLKLLLLKRKLTDSSFALFAGGGVEQVVLKNIFMPQTASR